MADNTQYQDDQGELDVPSQPLAQDNDTPSAPPDEQDDQLPADHPALDSNIDAHELYDEGYSGAAEVPTQKEYDDGQ